MKKKRSRMDKPNRLRRHFPFFFPFYFSFGFFLFLIVAEDTWTQTPPQKNYFFSFPFLKFLRGLCRVLFLSWKKKKKKKGKDIKCEPQQQHSKTEPIAAVALSVPVFLFHLAPFALLWWWIPPPSKPSPHFPVGLSSSSSFSCSRSSF